MCVLSNNRVLRMSVIIQPLCLHFLFFIYFFPLDKKARFHRIILREKIQEMSWASPQKNTRKLILLTHEQCDYKFQKYVELQHNLVSEAFLELQKQPKKSPACCYSCQQLNLLRLANLFQVSVVHLLPLLQFPSPNQLLQLLQMLHCHSILTSSLTSYKLSLVIPGDNSQAYALILDLMVASTFTLNQLLREGVQLG